MKLKNYLMLALLGGLCTNLGAVEKKLAYSKSVGVTVYVTSETSQWCQDQLKLRMVADNDDVFQGESVGKLVKKLGALFKRECNKATFLTLEGVSKSGDPLYSGEADKTNRWALKEIEQARDNTSLVTSISNQESTSPAPKPKIPNYKTSFLKSGESPSLFPKGQDQTLISGLSMACDIRVFDLESSQFEAEDLFFKVGKGFKCHDGYLTGKGDLWIAEEDGNKLISISTRVIKGILFADYSFTNGVAVAVRQFESDGRSRLITWDGKNDGRGTYALAMHSISKYQHSGVTLRTWSWDRNLVLTDVNPLNLRNKRKINGIRRTLNKFSQEHYESEVEKSYWSTSYKKTYLALTDIYDFPNYLSFIMSDGMEYSTNRKKWTKLKYTNHVLNRYKEEQEEKRLVEAKRKKFEKKLAAATKEYQGAKMEAKADFRKQLKAIDFVQRGGFMFFDMKEPPTVEDVERYYTIWPKQLQPTTSGLSSAWKYFYYLKEVSSKKIDSGSFLLNISNHKIVWPENYINDLREDSVDDIEDGWVIVKADIFASEGDDGIMPQLKVIKNYQCKKEQCKELNSDAFLIDYIFNKKIKETKNG